MRKSQPTQKWRHIRGGRTERVDHESSHGARTRYNWCLFTIVPIGFLMADTCKVRICRCAAQFNIGRERKRPTRWWAIPPRSLGRLQTGRALASATQDGKWTNIVHFENGKQTEYLASVYHISGIRMTGPLNRVLGSFRSVKIHTSIVCFFVGRGSRRESKSARGAVNR